MKELLPLAIETEGLSLGRGTTDRGQQTALGIQLRSRRDQVIEGYRITFAGESKRAQLWQLLPTQPEGT